VIFEELTSPPPLGVGSTLRTRMRVMSREVEFDWRVTRFDSPRRMAIESTAGMLPTSFLLDFTDADEATGVAATVAGEPRGMLRLGEPMIAESVRTTLATGLARAKRLLEERQR
jgi:hypothetical protein